MAHRKIKIRPRGAQRQQEEKEPVAPQTQAEPVVAGTRQRRRGKWLDIVVLVLIAAVLIWLFVPFGAGDHSEDDALVETPEQTFDLSEYESRVEFYASAGYDIYDVIEVLRVPRNTVHAIMDAYRGQRDKANQPESAYRVYTYRDNPRRDALLLIEPELPVYELVIELNEPVSARIIEKDFEKVVHTTSVILPHPSLGNALWDADMPRAMLEKIEEAFAWTVDLHHLQAGDRIEMIYEAYVSDGTRLGIGRVFCFRFDTHDGTYYAFRYEDGPDAVFLDENALSMKRRFLKAPVKYSTITSHYGARWHPIKQEAHVHKGTDFAAPRGTPVLALADGTMTVKSYTSGNGNFVKIRHDETYDTQYLHLDNFEEAMEPGSYVKQGDVIGYVGSTGLATGPHVCLRFWKEGQQVNFIEEKAMDAQPLPRSALSGFLSYRDSLMQVINTN